MPGGNGLVDANPKMVTFGGAKRGLRQMLNVGDGRSAHGMPPESQAIGPRAPCTQVRRLARGERASRTLHVGTNGLNRVDVRVQSRGSVALHLVPTEDPSVHIAYAVLGEELGPIRTMYFAPVTDSGGRDFLVYADLPADYDGPEPDVCVADGRLVIGASVRHDPALQQVRFANGIRVYEVPDRPGRGWMVADGHVVDSQQAALELVAGDGFDVRRTVAVEVPAEDLGALPGPRCAAPGGHSTVSVADEGPNVRLVMLKPPACGWLVLSEAHAPGWAAEADGAPAKVYRAHGGIQAVPLAAPAGQVVVRYRPRSVLAGGAIAAAGVIIAVLLIATEIWGRSSFSRRR